VTVTAPDATVETTVIVVQLRDLLQTYERQERADRVAFLSESPLPLPERTGTSPYFTFTYTVLIPVLVFLPVFISGSLVVDSITEEIDEGTFELLRVAPVTLGEIVDGKALAAVAIAPGQALLWLLLLRVNGTPVANVPSILVLMTALTTLVVALAIAISALAPDRRAAQFLYSIGVLVLFGGATAMAGRARERGRSARDRQRRRDDDRAGGRLRRYRRGRVCRGSDPRRGERVRELSDDRL